MIPINRENVRDVIVAVLCIAAAAGLFYLAGCGKPAGAENLPTKVVNGIDHPLTEPQPIYRGRVEPIGQSGVIEGITQLRGHPMGEQPPLQGGTGALNHTLPAKDLGISTSPIIVKEPPKCPNKLPALAVMLVDPSFPDVRRGAYLCNAREIVPAASSTKWRYVDQKRYGYQEWRQK